MRRWFLVGLPLVAVVVFVASNVHDPRHVTVHSTTLCTPRWEGPDLRVALLADFHLSDEGDLARIAGIGAELRARAPDLIVLAGDFAGDPALLESHGHHEIVGRLAAAFAPVAPTVAVLGNHDNWHEPALWREALQASNIRLVEGEVQTVEIGAAAICVRGLGDWYSGAWQWVEVPGSCDGVTLTVTHDPAGLLRHGELDSIGLAGHTHCGQITIPWWGPLAVPTTAPPDMHCGLFARGYPGFTTGGLGTSIVPLRFGPGAGARWELLTVTSAGCSGAQ